MSKNYKKRKAPIPPNPPHALHQDDLDQLRVEVEADTRKMLGELYANLQQEHEELMKKMQSILQVVEGQKKEIKRLKVDAPAVTHSSPITHSSPRSAPTWFTHSRRECSYIN